MRDHFDFHARAPGQCRNLDCGAGREIIGEVFRVNLVHADKIREVGQEDGTLHDIGKREFLVLKNGFDVLQDAIGLRFDVPGNQVAVLGIDWNLAGAKEQVTGAHSVIVGADGRWRFGGFDNCLRCHDFDLKVGFDLRPQCRKMCRA